MEDTWSDDAPGSPHEIPSEQRERKDEHNDEKKGAWCVGHACVGYRENSSLKNIRNACIEENVVFLKEETSEQKFFFEAI